MERKPLVIPASRTKKIRPLSPTEGPILFLERSMDKFEDYIVILIIICAIPSSVLIQIDGSEHNGISFFGRSQEVLLVEQFIISINLFTSLQVGRFLLSCGAVSKADLFSVLICFAAVLGSLFT